MAEAPQRPLWKRLLRVLGITILSVMATVPVWIMMMQAVKPPSNYYLHDDMHTIRENTAFMAMVLMPFALVFALFWLRSPHKRDFHPLIILGALTAGLLLLLVDGFVAILGDLEWFYVLIVLPAIILAVSEIKLPVPKSGYHGAVVIGILIALFAVFWVASPRQQKWSIGASLSERHAWAEENMGMPYLVAIDHIKGLKPVQDEFGEIQMIAPKKEGWFLFSNNPDECKAAVDVMINGSKNQGRCRLYGHYTCGTWQPIPQGAPFVRCRVAPDDRLISMDHEGELISEKDILLSDDLDPPPADEPTAEAEAPDLGVDQ